SRLVYRPRDTLICTRLLPAKCTGQSTHRLCYTCHDTERSTEMRTISAQEIKRRGISAVDELLKEGPVHVITHNEPRYVVMDEARYEELVEAHHEAYVARVL